MAIADDPGTLRTNALKAAVTLCLTYTLCFFIVGVWLRVRSRTYGRDDVLAMVATVRRNLLSRLRATTLLTISRLCPSVNSQHNMSLSPTTSAEPQHSCTRVRMSTH